MGLIIDSSVIIAAEKEILDFNKWQEKEEAYISAITVTELLIGVYRANTESRKIKRSAFIEHIINSLVILPFAEDEARIYAQVLQSLYKQNITIPAHDLIIASTAIANGCAVLTRNAKDFMRVPGLKVECI